MLLSEIEPHFKTQYDIKIQTVDDVWDFSKLKCIERDDPADLKSWVSKLFSNVSSTPTEIKEAYTFAEVQ